MMRGRSPAVGRRDPGGRSIRATEEFKICSSCQACWPSRKHFLEDPAAEIIGYQVNYEDLELGLFLFSHTSCGTTLAIPAVRFKDLYDGPVFRERMTGTKECSDLCQHGDALNACPARCECAWVREIIQVLRRKPADV